MTKLKKLILAAGVALAFGSGAASAASVGSTLFQGPQLLSDSSSELLINAPGTGVNTLDIGDRLMGIVTIEKTTQGAFTRALGLGSVNDELTGIFDLEVVAKIDTGVAGNSRFNWVFAPTSAANFTTDTGLVRPAGTMIAMFADPANDFNRASTVAIGIASVTGGTATAFWNLGFTGSATEFWVANAFTDNISLVGTLPPGQNGGGFNFGVNQLAGGNGPVLATTPCVNPVTGLGVVNACGNGSLTSKLAGSGWDSGNQAQIAVNIVPEPGTLALLGLGLLGFGLRFRRRT